MDFLRQHLQSTTNRMIVAIVLVHIVINALFAGAPTGLELYSWSNPKFQYWQLFTYMFLHADWWHLGLNMLAFWSFGRVLEQAWGGQRLLLFFVVCGLGAAVTHLGVTDYEFTQLAHKFSAAGMSAADMAQITAKGLDVSPRFLSVSSEEVRQFWMLHTVPAVGASGSVYGVLVAFALLFPGFKIILLFLPVPIAARYFVPILLLIDLSAGLTGFAIFGYNIAHFAHLGGALTGFLLVQFWLQKTRP